MKNILTLPTAYQLESRATFEHLKRRMKTVFWAYLVNPEELTVFKTVAREFGYPFLYTTNGNVAKEIWNITEPKTAVDHNWHVRKDHVWFAPSGWQTYNNDVNQYVML